VSVGVWVCMFGGMGVGGMCLLAGLGADRRGPSLLARHLPTIGRPGFPTPCCPALPPAFCPALFPAAAGKSLRDGGIDLLYCSHRDGSLSVWQRHARLLTYSCLGSSKLVPPAPKFGSGVLTTGCLQLTVSCIAGFACHLSATYQRSEHFSLPACLPACLQPPRCWPWLPACGGAWRRRHPRGSHLTSTPCTSSAAASGTLAWHGGCLLLLRMAARAGRQALAAAARPLVGLPQMTLAPASSCSSRRGPAGAACC
jgi:hypothetical protein